MTVSAGWGKPINRSALDPIHWYKSDGLRACNSGVGGVGYLGERISEREVGVSEVCPVCFNAVTNAREILL